MRLKQLEVHGFKTFATRTVFSFNAGITAVVGPNGSGKSNIADAIRWALGEQSYSILRTKKTEDIIFAGSTIRPRMGMSEVAITLENPFALGEAEPKGIPRAPNGGDSLESRPRASVIEELLKARPAEVTILRRAYRSGENEYLINRQRVRLRDVQELLQHWGLARNTYAVVGQGLIDAALSLRAEERRALFEEAAGIGLYQSKKQSALEKLEETQQNLMRANDIINEIAPRLPSLARQADRARRYESVATALTGKLREWYAYQWAQAQDHHARAASVEGEARAKLNDQRHQMHDTAVRLAQARHEAQALRAQLSEQRRARTARESEYAARERELAVQEERLSFVRQQREESVREAQSLASSADEHGPRLTAARARRTELEHQRARIIARKRLAEGRIAEMETGRALAPKGRAPGDARDLARRLIELQQMLPLYERALPAVARLAARAEALANQELTRREREQLRERARGELNEAATAWALIERDIQSAQLLIDNALEAQKQVREQLDAKGARVEQLTRQVETAAAQRDRLQAAAQALAREFHETGEGPSPDEARLGESERLQSELEDQEALARSQLTVFEEIHNRAVLDAERSRAEIARLESEIEDDLGTVELDAHAPRQLRLRLAFRRAVPGESREGAQDFATGEEAEATIEEEERELIALPEVAVLPDGFDKEIRRLKNQMKYIGNVNPNAPVEYEGLKQRHAFLTEQAADLVQAIERLHQAIAELDEMMQERFKETFDAINAEFKHYFNLLFGGGTARLELTEPDNLIQSGIEIIAKPPGKRAAHLAILSGGERSLTACSLLFAILKASPTPFCVLDEVDAMLDEANVSRFRDALKELGSNSQFIVITHNRATIESANTVYGVSMGDDGVSQVISMRLSEAAGQAAVG